MIRRLLLAASIASTPASVLAQDAPKRSVGMDVTVSADADDTSVIRTGLNADWHYESDEKYTGFRLERTGYRPLGGDLEVDKRAYLRLGRPIGNWKTSLSIGSDLKNVYGSATVHNEATLRQEYFLERDKVETPIGVRRPIVYTFGGAAIDVPFSQSSQVTLLGGLQTFTGKNERIHLRANFIQVLKSEWGLSGQLRTRYFHNSTPNEFDYYSPRWFAEILPVLQVRRFRRGWRAAAAVGYGGQRDASSDWRQSRYANFRVNSPSNKAGWALNADATYSNQPITNLAESYTYVRANLGIARHF